ncbi:hypothetical protein D3C86_1681800 [compost metagenome]
MPGISSLRARRAITFTSTTFSSLRSVPAAEIVVSSGSVDGSITGYEMLAVTMPRPVGTGSVKALGLRAGASPASTTNNTSVMRWRRFQVNPVRVSRPRRPSSSTAVSGLSSMALR